MIFETILFDFDFVITILTIDGQQLKDLGTKIIDSATDLNTIGKVIGISIGIGIFFVTVGYFVGEWDGSNERERKELERRNKEEEAARKLRELIEHLEEQRDKILHKFNPDDFPPPGSAAACA